jgi:hypothetical protein
MATLKQLMALTERNRGEPDGDEREERKLDKKFNKPVGQTKFMKDYDDKRDGVGKSKDTPSVKEEVQAIEEKTILSLKSFLAGPDVSNEQHNQNYIEGLGDYNLITDPSHTHIHSTNESIEPNADNSKRVDVRGKSNSSGVSGLEVPKHMLEGKNGLMEFHKKAQAEFPNSDGSTPRHEPMGDKELQRSHKALAEEHAKLPEHEQIKKEKEARGRLGKLGVTSVLSQSDKTDTMLGMKHPKTGKPIVSAPSVKNVAGHAVYPVGDHEHHIINTCRGQTEGCGGKVDASGKISTRTGTCFAPNAEAQYKDAAAKRAKLTYSSHHPHLHKDVFHATVGELRDEAAKGDKAKTDKEGEKGGHVVVRPDTTAENDNDKTAHAVALLNKQRSEKSKTDGKSRPEILINRYSKTGQEGSTYSNTGPKVKNGGTIGENVRRDSKRHNQTVKASDSSGKDFVKASGEKEEPRHQYMVNDLKRNGDEEKKVDAHLHTVRHWSAPVANEHLTGHEKTKSEAHYDANGKETTEDKAHTGFASRNGRTYRYSNHHVIPKRYPTDGHPADDRLFDSHHMSEKYKSKEGGLYSSNGKRHGGVIMTSPTDSTSNHKRQHAEFTHPVSKHVDSIVKTGRYDVDHPDEQEAARGKEYKEPIEGKAVKSITGLKKAKL